MFIESVDRIIPQEFDVFVGLDVDARSYSVTTLNWAGNVHQFTMSAQAKGLVSWRQQNLPRRGWRGCMRRGRPAMVCTTP